MLARFCSNCAHELLIGTPPGEERPRQFCPVCGTVQYENSKPCAGALVVRNGKVLLARRARPPAEGMWDIPGGFLEAGEHPREGAIRELREETGLDITPKREIGIYMDRYGSSGWTLNVYYLANAEGEPQPASDVAELAWFAPDDLPDAMAFPHEVQVLNDLKALLGP